MKKSFLKFSILFLCIGFLFAACAGEENKSPVPTGASGSQSASTNTENPLSPGNLPPPGSEADANLSEMSSKSSLFFQKKELWDSFSEDLRDKVWENYSHSAQLTGAGPGGHGYYNTLFGRVSPVKVQKNSEISLNSKAQYFKEGQKMFLMKKNGGQGAQLEYCDFLCLDSPEDKLNTIYDSVIVAGRINLDKLAIFSPSDPVMMISVFKQAGPVTETVAQDIPIYASDVNASPVNPPNVGGGSESQPAPPSSPEDIGSFGKTVPLLGPGEYAVIITAFKKVGEDVAPDSTYITVYRQDIPKIELLTITPPVTGNQSIAEANHRNDPLKKASETLLGEYHAGMVSVNLVVKVSTIFNSIDGLEKNIGILFQNYDLAGKLRYSSSGNESYKTVSTFIPELADDKSPAKKAELPLFEGYNKIFILSHNQQLDDFYLSMGLQPPPSQKIEFIINNTLPRVSIKLISPAEGSIVEPKGVGNEKMNISFCMTDLPVFPGRLPARTSGECIPNWNGDQPKVTFNKYEYGVSPAAPLSYDATTGIYSISATPSLGSNILKVSVANKNYLPSYTESSGSNPVSVSPTLGSLTTSFQYGKVNKLFENGSVKEKDNFLSRGLSLEINNNIIQKDLKTILLKYLNKPEFKDTFISAFKKDTPGITSICSEGGEYTVDTGDTTIDILPDTLKLGPNGDASRAFEILNLTSGNDGKLHLSVRLNGFTAEADMRGLNSNVKLQHNGKDYGFIPLSITIDQLTLNADVKFTKDDKGYSKLDITAPASGKAVELVGGDGLSNSVHVNSNRNPLAAGLEMTDVNGGILQASFEKSLTKTIVCGVENGLNNTTTGLGKWREDILKLVSYNNLNPFRIPLEFELLNKLVGIDIAYDLLRGDIQFSGRGITIRNVPLRISPSPRILNDLPGDIKNALVGSLSMPQQNPELSAALPATDENMNISMSLSEDAINQALFAANMAGMINLDIDPNFYTNNKIDFISRALPSVDGMFPNKKVDFNRNGVQDDADLPVLLRIKADPSFSPTIHFLNRDEVNELANKVNSSLGNENGSLNKDQHFFRFSVSNLELAFYALEPISYANGGYKSFCTNEDDSLYSDQALENSRHKVSPMIIKDNKVEPELACSQKLSLTYETTDGTCGKGYNAFTSPVKNGAIISALPDTPEVPVIRIKANIVLYGVIQGVYREVLASDKWKLDPADSSKGIEEKGYQATNFLRIKLLTYAPANPLFELVVSENRSSFSPKDLTDHLTNTVLPSALGKDCEFFNEIRVPIPDSLLKDKTNMSEGLQQTLKDFGLDSINLGTTENSIPETPYNSGFGTNENISNSLYFDLRAHLGICYLGELCN